ncbi:SipW-dependent-type signal peptide-containing protein [Dietzia psychralcaliphila]|uniref:Ribosomally synthesized peptide with SipW-like signal peptide n=1 Tax=Dietzia psychralcaliphila TaxID=139021 RepID=A0AAD0JVY8_9ACTN|nr:SipW-dependent-type signal peptide-containing protein [Dietzia psychralcaliphila]AWH96548.1 hypothetical protein A6048_14800 [Dietzia psychralcaliphila]PTM90281.1 putative ribosomally synthesized peptide with SipW-like signal peptide [Dietzia psychralcaliphila]
MNANDPITPDAQQKQDRARKRKAILAGGVVLGLGAAVTLAAWSDDVFADGIFNTGSFELQGSLDGTTFLDYDGPAYDPTESASLEFQLEAEEMAPSQTVYAPFTIGTEEDTSLDGTFTLQSVSSSGTYAGVLSYQIFEVNSHSENCNPDDAENLPTVAWVGGPTAKVNETTVTGLNDPLEVVADNQAPYQHLCIAVTLGNVSATATENQAAVLAAGVPAAATTVSWVFNGQSTDA